MKRYGHEFVSEFIPWDDFYTLMRWRQGEHVTVLAPTEGGKTTLMLNLLAPQHRRPKRDGFVIVAATKRRDEQLDALKRKGFYETRGMDYMLWDRTKHLFRPPLESLTDTAQQAEFARLLETVFKQGKITLYADEVRYLTDILRLKRHMEVLWLQGRALRITIVAGTQRPSWIPLEAYSQAKHLFFGRSTDERDLKRVSDIGGGIDRDVLRRDIRKLPEYQFLYVNVKTDEMCRTQVPKELATIRS